MSALVIAVGDHLGPAVRRRLIERLQRASGFAVNGSVIGSVIARLAPDRIATRELVDLVTRAIDLPRGAVRCPGCLADGTAGPCGACDAANRAWARARSAAAAETARRPSPPPSPPPAPVAPVDPAAPALLDRYDLEDIKASCASKNRYTTLAFAEGVARQCMARRGGYVRAYECQICGGAHLTHRRARVAA